MSLDVALARMAQLQSLFAPPVANAAPVATPTENTSSFERQLQSAGATATLTGAQAPAGTAGQAIVNLVRNEIGVS
jgi:hypothetical protein